jgi:hypothetical protein
MKENVVLAMHNNPTDNWLMALLPRATFKEYLEARSKKWTNSLFMLPTLRQRGRSPKHL